MGNCDSVRCGIVPFDADGTENSVSSGARKLRVTPYPQKEHTLYLNPAPLLVPVEMRKAEYLQFALSQDQRFPTNKTLQSKPVPWCMFNPHQVLASGTWYWRFRSVDKAGKELPWSETYSFAVMCCFC